MVASSMPARKLPPPGEEEEDYGSETTLGSRFRRAITLSFGMALAAWPGILHSNLSTVGVPTAEFGRTREFYVSKRLCAVL